MADIRDNMSRYAGAARKYGPAYWNGTILPPITENDLRGTAHRTLIEQVLTSASDPTGAVVSLSPFDYHQLNYTSTCGDAKASP